MSGFNQTCALTDTPIAFKTPVLVFNYATGPRYSQSVRSPGSTVELLFGLPFRADYDGEGGAQNIAQPAATALLDKAWSSNPWYRPVPMVMAGGFVGETSRTMARDANALWSLQAHMKTFFYGRHGVRPEDLKACAGPGYDRTKLAYRASEAAVKAFGAALKDLELPVPQHGQEQVLLELCAKHFGPDLAWLAYEQLRKNGLFAQRDQLFVRQDAYAALVASFGKRKGNGYKTKGTLRSYLGQELRGLLDDMEGLKRRASAFNDLAEASGSASLEEAWRSYSVKRESLRPLSHLWCSEKVPLMNHFWEGAEPQEVVDAYGESDVLDYLVFQWAFGFLRRRLQAPCTLSQSDDYTPQAVASRAAFATLAKTPVPKYNLSIGL
jgi:hypothetical protein